MPKRERPSVEQVRGTVLALNISPKGHIEGVMVKTAHGPAQVNFPNHEDEARAKTLRAGARVTLAAALEDDQGDHPVYRACGEAGAVRGTIVRLNYALHGEVNGYHLDEGTFVHVKPEGAKKYMLHVGDELQATGSRRSGPDAVVLEAREVERLSRRA